MMSIALSLHLLSAVIWVGGMFFAYVCLRPVAAQLLDPPVRFILWSRVFSSFFVFVWLAIITLIVTGHGMISLLGGMAAVGKHVHIMLGLGYVMFLIFGHVFFAGLKRLKMAVAISDWEDAANRLSSIRRLVGLNLSLGIITVIAASAGKYLL
ncbi:MAG: CopD family protein [Oleiphilus sp.]